MMTEHLLVERRGEAVSLTLNRPEVLNALNGQLRRALTEALQAANVDPNVRVVILQGAGRAFCAGQDQRESSQFDADSAADRIRAYVDLFDAMRRMSKPVIAKIHGYAVGAGFQIALLADLRIAADASRVGLTELNVGAPCITGSAILWPVAGEAVVKKLVLTGALVAAPEAKSLGLLDEIVADVDLHDRVWTLAAELAKKPAFAVAVTKEWWRMIGETLFQATREFAVAAHAQSFASGELKKGAAAFISRAGGRA